MNVASDSSSSISTQATPKGSFHSNLDLGLAKFATALFLLCGSRFLEFVPGGDLIRAASIVLQILIAMYGIISTFLSGYIASSLFSFLLMLTIPLSSYNFSIVSGGQFVPFSGGDYFAISFVALFFKLTADQNIEKLLDFIYKASIFYVLCYIVLWISVKLGIVHPLDTSKIVRASGGGDDRGLRLAFMVAFVLYAACVSTVIMVARLNFVSVFNFLVVVLCLTLSGSRLICLIAGLVISLYLPIRNSKTVSHLVLVIFIFELAFVTFVILDHSFNPFDLFTTEGDRVGDISAWARWKALNVLNDLIPNNWLFGIGIPNGPAGYEPVTHLNFVFPEDLGLFGVFAKFGIFGYLIYVAICFMSFAINRRALFEKRYFSIGLRISFSIFCLYSLMSPIFFSSGLIFSAIILAVSLRPKFFDRSAVSSH